MNAKQAVMNAIFAAAVAADAHRAVVGPPRPRGFVWTGRRKARRRGKARWDFRR